METKGIRSGLAADHLKSAMNNKIDNTEVQRQLRKEQESNGYNVLLSKDSQDIAAATQKAMDIAKNTSPIRQDRVDVLKAMIDSGEYKVDPEKIADGMLREAIKEKLAEE